jgi:hypothetical protein
VKFPAPLHWRPGRRSVPRPPGTVRARQLG